MSELFYKNNYVENHNINDIFNVEKRIPVKKKSNIKQQKIPLSKTPKLINIYAKLQSNNRAEFTNDYFYNILESLTLQHYQLLGEVPISYHKPFNKKEFYFKSSRKFILMKDKNGDIITDDKLYYGKSVNFVLKVKPYNINNKKIGLNIQVSSIIV